SAPGNGHHCLLPVKPSDIFSDSVSLITMYTAFALFEVYGIGRQIPVHDGMTKKVKVESFLAHGRGGQYKRSKGRIERVPDQHRAHPFAVVGSLLTEAQGEVPAHTVVDQFIRTLVPVPHEFVRSHAGRPQRHD